MKTKTIFKTLAMAMMMPAMLLTTACSSDDDAIANNNETPAKKGYPLQVTVNVTRQGDNATTRATYTDNGNKTGSLSFSSGDQLFIYGEDENAGQFAGTLTWVSGETFSGTITTEYSYSGTAKDLFSSAGSASSDYYLVAELLPNGYEAYGFISITENDGYGDELSENINNTFATTKALAVEQFSWEWTDEYDNGFALSPGNSILNFTISGLTASTEVNVALKGNGRNITGEVTTDGSGTATFAIGVPVGIRIEYYSLTVGGNAITLPEKLPEHGKIYNISRSVAAAPTYTMAANATTDDKGKLICTEGHIHAYNADAECTATRVAKIIYIGTTGHATYTHGLALALTDEGQMAWGAAMTACNTTKNTNTPVTDATWLLASGGQWNYMKGNNGAGSASALRTGFEGVSGTNMVVGEYWSSTVDEDDDYCVYALDFRDGQLGSIDIDGTTRYVRAALAF